MSAAEEFQRIGPRIAFWQAYEPAVKCDLSSCAILTGGGWVFVDPILLAKPALAELLVGGAPAAIVLTNSNHARAAARYRELFSIPVLASGEAVPELEVSVDRVVCAGDLVFEELTVVSVPGAGPGEIALHFGSELLVMGDALINIEPEGLRFLPEKYCADAKALRHSVLKLLALDFERMTFAHGLPIGAQARQKLQTLLV